MKPHLENPNRHCVPAAASLKSSSWSLFFTFRPQPFLITALESVVLLQYMGRTGKHKARSEYHPSHAAPFGPGLGTFYSCRPRTLLKQISKVCHKKQIFVLEYVVVGIIGLLKCILSARGFPSCGPSYSGGSPRAVGLSWW